MSIHVVEFYVIYMKFKKIYTDHVKKIYVIYMVSKPVWILFIHWMYIFCVHYAGTHGNGT